MIREIRPKCNGYHRHPRGAIVTPYVLRRAPDAIPGASTCESVDDYLRECAARRERGWNPNYPATRQQGLAAYRAGLSRYRPAPDEPDRAAYDRIDANRDRQAADDDDFSRLLAMLADSPDRRAALRAAMREQGVRR